LGLRNMEEHPNIGLQLHYPVNFSRNKLLVNPKEIMNEKKETEE